MEFNRRGFIKLRAMFLFGALAFLFAFSLARANAEAGDALPQGVRGIYTFEEWHKDGNVFRPPQVEGRFVLQDGTIMTALHNRIQSPNQTTVLVYGGYQFESSTFTYGYDSTSIFTETPSGTTVSHKPLFEGKRSFVTVVEGKNIRLRSEGGKQELLFSSEGLTYSENGQVLRVWRRLSEH